MMSDCDTSDGQGACAGTLAAAPDDGLYRKQPLSEATLEALGTLVERGGVAGQAAQEMLNAELLGADREYAARIASISVPHSEPMSWLSRVRAHIRAGIVKA